ncbi:MAG: hypothetical protein PHC61_00490, partial [Chitinivibrionales bacterium]|nr:hypothetical protein [Chitinivibrionales bacterium]
AEDAAANMPQLTDMRNDLGKLVKYLAVITNNTATSIGGGGAPRKPLAPGLMSFKTAVTAPIFDVKSFSFNATANAINYSLSKPCFVSIKYYDLSGKLVCSFVNNYQQAGRYTIKAPLSRNIYIRDFRAGDFVAKERVAVLR